MSEGPGERLGGEAGVPSGYGGAAPAPTQPVVLRGGHITDSGLDGGGFIVSFAVIYLAWGLAYTANDIPYWSMLPAEIVQAVLRSDQLLWTALSMVLFMTASITTTSFGVYFFKYAYRDENMFAVFAGIIGISQLIGFIVFPVLRRRFARNTIFTSAFIAIAAGYVGLFLAPMRIVPIVVAGFIVFAAQSLVVVLMLMFIADCIDYGHWKLGRRSGAVTFAVQQFINKVGGALATAIVGVTLIITGISAALDFADVTASGLAGMKAMMLLFPVLLMSISYVIYRTKYQLDQVRVSQIIEELQTRGKLLDR